MKKSKLITISLVAIFLPAAALLYNRLRCWSRAVSGYAINIDL